MNEYRKQQLDEIYKAVNEINDLIVEEGIDLSTFPAQLADFGYSEKDIDRIKISLINIEESLKNKEPAIKPDTPKTRSWFNPNMATSLPTPYSWNPNIKQDSPVEICYDDDISSAPYSGPMPLDGGLKD